MFCAKTNDQLQATKSLSCHCKLFGFALVACQLWRGACITRLSKLAALHSMIGEHAHPTTSVYQDSADFLCRDRRPIIRPEIRVSSLWPSGIHTPFCGFLLLFRGGRPSLVKGDGLQTGCVCKAALADMQSKEGFLSHAQ
jgi:hypothetical protein